MAEALPLALGIAASPFPIVPAILLLFTPRPRVTGAAFLGGWAAGIAAGVLVFVALASVIEAAEDTPTWASWTRLGLGAVLVAIGVRQWLGRSAKTSTPGWMASIETAGPASAFRLGLLLSAANPKVLLLAAGAGLVLGADDTGTARTLLATIAFTVVASTTVALPMVLHAILGERMDRPLRRAKDWLVAHNAGVVAVVIVVLGVLLLFGGATGL